MTSNLSRRTILTGLAAGLGSAAIAEAPLTTPRPAPRVGPVKIARRSVGEGLVRAAGLGGTVTFLLTDANSGEILDARLPTWTMPPASTMKTITSLYALERLGGEYRFKTEIYAQGSISNGRLEGDLILAGGGDPTLDTDRLADLAIALRETGLIEVTGRLLVWSDALPRGDRIDAEQPEHVSYNPAFCGLNLNFNRVHFEWKPKSEGFDITMQARSARFSPSTNVARMSVVDRKSPVYDYARGQRVDRWSVSRGALGKKKGARWLPVRFPALYTGDVFRTLARSNGIVLPPPELAGVRPAGRVIASIDSDPLSDILTDMMRYSTNLTAEVAGLSASLANGVSVANLLGSGSRMAGWAETRFGVKGARFRDHSGLGYGSAISAKGMVDIIRQNPQIAEFMKPVNVPDTAAKNGAILNGVSAVAKTGTLNFVSSLTGFVTTKSKRNLAFAIFTADTERRDAIPPDERERPPGARGWSRRSRRLQKSLLGTWAKAFAQV
jgi:D-alanyl-D-alanine carboxypeptidase/D-alanyl-D-alanine-endopeptidase (penicillin-binding protein 4)